MSQNKFFGTDGVRGSVNQFPITVAQAMKIGTVIGGLYKKSEDNPIRVVIGKDTRSSGYMLESAVASGLMSSGANILFLGPLPTPSVAFITRTMRADLGIVISASHNNYKDNGLKFFDSQGRKLNESVQSEIEKNIDSFEQYLIKGSRVGRAQRINDVIGRYVEYLKSTIPFGINNFSRLKIVVDLANGAAYKIVPNLLWELHGEVIAVGNQPDGFNINEKCGAIHVNNIQQHVLKHGADIGITFDGDADRIIVCDENGKIYDGDDIIALLAKYLLNSKKSGSSLGIVSTKMSNLGLEEYLKSENIFLHYSDIGDKKVSDKMDKVNALIGGEQSGHIILKKYGHSGDGILVALQILSILKYTQLKASELLSIIPKKYSQKSSKVSFTISHNKIANYIESSKIQELQNTIRKNMNSKGRVLIRKSGTENIVRIMIEAENENLAQDMLSFAEKKISDDIKHLESIDS